MPIQISQETLSTPAPTRSPLPLSYCNKSSFAGSNVCEISSPSIPVTLSRASPLFVFDARRSIPLLRVEVRTDIPSSVLRICECFSPSVLDIRQGVSLAPGIRKDFPFQPKFYKGDLDSRSILMKASPCRLLAFAKVSSPIDPCPAVRLPAFVQRL